MTSNKRKKRQKITPDSSLNATTPQLPDSAPLSKQSAGRIWLFRLTALIAIPLLFFSILEIGLRLGGYGYPTSFYLKSEGPGDFKINNRFGWRFFPPELARSPEPHVLKNKATGTIRIFVLGSSAAKGFPNPAFSFGRILEVMLQTQYPGTKFEVINAAMTAINSHAVLEIARDCSRFQPDLFIVYMGNNEVIGPFGPGTVFQKWSSNLNLIRANLQVKSTRTGQLLGNAMRSLRPEKNSKVWLGMEMFIHNPVAADDSRIEAVYDNLHSNLNEICEVARNSGAGIILSTTAVNLKDCPPFASQHRADLISSGLSKWDSIYSAGVELENNKQWLKALVDYEAAAQIDNRHAGLRFHMGTCLAELGRFDEAREQFLSACDLDTLRFRADRKINKTIKEVAAAHKDDGIHFVDTEHLLTQGNVKTGGIPGNEFFFEHVHFTFDGNYRLAQIILDQVGKSLPQLAASRNSGPILTKEQCAQALAMTSWDEYESLTQIAQVMSRPPFTNQMNHSARITAINEQTENLRKLVFMPENYQDYRNAHKTALEKRPGDWNLHYRFGKLLLDGGELEPAADQFNAAQKIYPWDEGLNIYLGNAALQKDQIKKAVSYYYKALEIRPDFISAHSNLILAMAKQGSIDEANAHFQKAIGIDPNYDQSYINMGIVQSNRGNSEGAIENFQRALKINPANPVAWNNLGNALISRRQANEAIEKYRKAIELNPNYEEAYLKLGSALVILGDIAEGMSCYQKAISINPRNAMTYYLMGCAEVVRERIAIAKDYYRDALKINPRFVDAHLEISNILGQEGAIEEAIEHAQKAIESSPQNASAYYQLGSLFAVQGETEKAIANFKHTLKIDPGFREAQSALLSLQ
jgi:tetratricopeptide (TPR) repeat protein